MNKTLLSTVLALMAASTHAADAVLAPTPAPVASPTPATAQPASNATVPTQQIPANMDCSYHIPPNQTTIDPVLITSWAEKAALQAFTFNPADIDNQMNSLKACFTEQGWKGFSDALDKSGNISSIKSQQLNVSSQVDGEKNINTIKDNQWKVMLPIQVVYQNDKEKVTQHLKVDVLVGRKMNGDLGIMQMIAVTKPSESADTGATTQPSKDTNNSAKQSVVMPDSNTPPSPTPNTAQPTQTPAEESTPVQ